MSAHPDPQESQPSSSTDIPIQYSNALEAGVDAQPTELLERVETEKEIPRLVGSDGAPGTLAQTASAARIESAFTHTTIDEVNETRSLSDDDSKRKWTYRLDPFKRKTKPPVPQHRGESREAKAGFWSKLTFQWMGPIMMVSDLVS